MEKNDLDCVLVEAVKGGYTWRFTLRAKDAATLFEKIDEVMAKFEKQGYVPTLAGSTGPKFARVAPVATPKPTGATTVAPETKMCPIHNAKMYYHDGKYGPFYSHGNKETGYCNGTEKGNKIDADLTF